MSGTASIGRSWKFQAPSAAIARTAIITSQRWRMAQDRRPSIIAHRRALRHLRLDDEAVASGIDVTLQHAKGDLDILAVALAEFDLAHLESVAVADEDRGMVIDRLHGRGLHRDRDLLAR